MMLNEDYKDMLLAFSGENVSYLLVGAYAMAVHGYPRATIDIDLWVLPSPDNADAVLRALRRFGAPLDALSKDDLTGAGVIFQIGVAPRRIDIITSVDGLRFEDAFKHSLIVNIDGTDVRVLAIGDLIRNKKATGRTKDLADAEALELLRDSSSSTSERE